MKRRKQIIAILAANGEAKVAEIAEATGASKQAVWSCMAKLERDNLIVRGAGKKTWRLTEEGRAIAEDAQAVGE